MQLSWGDFVRFMPVLLRGAWLTVLLTIVTMAISLVLALFVGLARSSKRKVYYLPATFYVEVIRGTPALLQVFYIFYVLPLAGVTLSPFVAGVTALTINYTAFLAEVYRAGLEAVDQGQREAALALGMSSWQMHRLVVLPQAIRIILPPIANYFLSLIKDTSLVSLITIEELMFSGQRLAAVTFKHFQIYTMIGLIYLAICYPVSRGIAKLERHLKTNRPRRRPAITAQVDESQTSSGVNL